MSDKIALTSKRTLTRSTTSNPVEDQYTFQSDDDDHQVKETLLRKRPRGRPAKTPSISSTNSETDEPTKRSYEKPVTRRASRLGSQTNTTREKIKTETRFDDEERDGKSSSSEQRRNDDARCQREDRGERSDAAIRFARTR